MPFHAHERSVLSNAWKVGSAHGKQRANAEYPQRQSETAAYERQYEALCQQLANDAPAPCPDRRADRELAFAPDGTH